MIPQGLSPLNTAYFTALTDSINEAGSCAELQELITSAFASLGAVTDAITAEFAAVEPWLALLTPPTTPQAVITWVEKLITSYLTPLVKPAVTMVAQLTELTAQIAALTAAISSAEAKFTSCSISVPTISITVPTL
jgi:hypothetical protein